MENDRMTQWYNCSKIEQFAMISRPRLCVLHTNHDGRTSYSFEETPMQIKMNNPRKPCIISCSTSLPLGSPQGNKPVQVFINTKQYMISLRSHCYTNGISRNWSINIEKFNDDIGKSNDDIKSMMILKKFNDTYKDTPYDVDRWYTDLLKDKNLFWEDEL